MSRLLITILAVAASLATHAQQCAHPIKLVVIGSSTSAGTGASVPDSAYVSKLRKFMTDSVNAGCTVENLAVGGATTYKMQPNWYIPPANRSSFPVDTNRNIDKAISLMPDGIIINYPSNDVANNFTLQEQKDNFLRVKAKADSAGIPIWVTTTQPRNMSTAQNQMQIDMRNWILGTFAAKSIDFWTTLAETNGNINPLYNSGDNVHLNDAGHAILFERVKGEGIHFELCNTPATVQEQVQNSEILSVYPNPVKNILHIKTSQTQSSHYRITDMAGRTVMQGSINQPANKELTLDITSLATGSYIFELAGEDNKQQALILKE